jgi:hypothetical protein
LSAFITAQSINKRIIVFVNFTMLLCPSFQLECLF